MRPFFEHERVRVGTGDGLPADCLDDLHYLADRTTAFFAEEGGPRGARYVRFKGLVGVVQLPGGLTIEILPKISGLADEDRLNLITMLAETGQLPSLIGDSATYKAGETLIEAYLRHVADLAWRLMHTGVSRRYVAQDRQSPFISGQWLVAKQLARSPMRVDRHELRLAELTPDTPLNRVLKCGLKLMARLAAAPEVGARLQAAGQMLDGVADIPAAEAVRIGVAFDRLTASWQGLYDLVVQFLRALLPTLEAGERTRSLAWLFDMNKLFEAFVAQRLAKALPDKRVHAQGPGRMLASHIEQNYNLFLQCPDLIIDSADSSPVIADTKWKRLDGEWLGAVSAADIRQVFTYGRLYKSKRVVLLYPASDEGALRTERLKAKDDSNLEMMIAEIPVRRSGLDALNDRLVELFSIGGGE